MGFAHIFEMEGNELLIPDFFGETPEVASKNAAEFAKELGLTDTGRSFEFVGGARMPNRMLTIAFPGGVIYQALCIKGPKLEEKNRP